MYRRFSILKKNQYSQNQKSQQPQAEKYGGNEEDQDMPGISHLFWLVKNSRKEKKISTAPGKDADL